MSAHDEMGRVLEKVNARTTAISGSESGGAAVGRDGLALFIAGLGLDTAVVNGAIRAYVAGSLGGEALGTIPAQLVGGAWVNGVVTGLLLAEQRAQDAEREAIGG